MYNLKKYIFIIQLNQRLILPAFTVVIILYDQVIVGIISIIIDNKYTTVTLYTK